ncbi:hypothetical protein GCM10020331_093400 [Ectobacillus funiculus]
MLFLKGEGYEYVLSQGLYDTYHLADEKDEGITVKGKKLQVGVTTSKTYG